MHVNETIWDFTDTIKSLTTENTGFADIANTIFEFNQKRFRLKNFFNILTTSNLKEQKSYAESHCKIIIEEEETLYDKISEIHYLTLEYDRISFESPFIETIKKIFKSPNISYDYDDLNPTKIINIKNFPIESRILIIIRTSI